MLLSKKLIKTELEKIYPDIIFDNKYSENFIQVIKFNILRKLNKLLENSSKEEAISIISSFCFKIERTTESFYSIYRISDDLILESKQSIFEDFNPEYYLMKKSYISKEEESIIIALLIYKKVVLDKTTDINITWIKDEIHIFSEEEQKKYIKKTFIKEDTVSKYDLHFTIKHFKRIISAYDKLKELFISFEIEK